MFTFLFIVGFVVPPLLFLIGAAWLQSWHLLFGGILMTLVSALFYGVSKAAEKKRGDKTRGTRGCFSSGSLKEP